MIRRHFFLVAAIDRGEWVPFGWAALTTTLAAGIFLSRFSEFGYRFADQAWKDFAAVVGGTRDGAVDRSRSD